jgi:amino acid transporter
MTTAKSLGFWPLVAIGVGGMVGGGIFAVLGLAVQMAGGATPIAFAVAGVIALLTSYSYARLAVAYPHGAGTVAYLDRAFGPGYFTGSANVLLWLSYIVTLSLYAYAFGSYGASFFSAAAQPLAKHLLISAVVLLMTLLNVLGAQAIGKAEVWIVAFKMTILSVFAVVGLWGLNAAGFAPATWVGARQIVAGGMVIFVAYEGFELIANAAVDAKDAARNVPRALFAGVGFVIFLYILIAFVTLGNLPVAKIVAAKDYALAVAAEPFLGRPGFTFIAIAALASTASAINATLYGVTRMSYLIAKDGELPAVLEKKTWRKPLGGLFISAALTLAFANLFDLSRIATIGSAGFLIIFAAVNAANFRLRRNTRSTPLLPVLGVVLCLVAMGALIWETAKLDAPTLWVLVGLVGAALLIEAAYRWGKGREIKLRAPGE